MKHRFSFISCFVLFLLVCTSSSQAAEFHVTSASEFQSALAAAGNNGGDDTIMLASGTYYGNFRYTAAEPNALTISTESNAPEGSVILDGQQKAYVLKIYGGGNDLAVAIKGLTILNGKSSGNGGGVLAERGGAANPSGTIEITRCIVMNNTSLNKGGGIYISEYANVHLSQNTIKQNHSINSGVEYGTGFLIINSRNVVVSKNNVIENSGNGISLIIGSTPEFASTADISSNIISGNTGPGLFVMSVGNLLVENNAILENKTYSDGAAVYAANIFHNSSFVNNLISSNEASYRGGGIFLDNEYVFNDHLINFINNTIVNQKMAGTQLASFGGALFLKLGQYGGSILNIENNIFWNNAASNGKDIYLSNYAKESNFYNNIYSEYFAVWDNQSGNLNIDPLFYDASNGDFHLSATSPGLNAGLNTAPEIPAIDLDGNPRIIDVVVDIGAYERSTADLHPADLNSNWTIETDEFTNYGAAWKLNSAWQNVPNPIPRGYVSRAGYLLQKGGTYKNIGVGKPATWVPTN